MGTYQKGDDVKIEITNEHSGESEWMWLLVDNSDDDGDSSSASWILNLP